MSLYSIPFLRDFEAITGFPSGYKPQGYLFAATKERHMEYLRANLARQLALGLKTVREVSPAEIAEMVPQLRTDDIIGGTFCSTDGFVDPHSMMTGFTQKAIERGAELIRECEATGVQLDAQGIAGVTTKNGTIATRTVVNAANAWAASIGKSAGVELPIEPLRRTLVPTEPFDKISHTAPMVVDMSTGFHFRPEGRGLLLAWNDPEETPGFKYSVDRGFVEKVLTYAVDRVPCLEQVEVNPSRAWAGLYDMSPDHHSILGAVKAVPGFFVAIGFSGHGVMHSPATGRIVSDLILKGSTGVIDARMLDFERFAEGRAHEETAVL
jgi:sarcosine oxidase subunit beta